MFSMDWFPKVLCVIYHILTLYVLIFYKLLNFIGYESVT